MAKRNEKTRVEDDAPEPKEVPHGRQRNSRQKGKEARGSSDPVETLPAWVKARQGRAARAEAEPRETDSKRNVVPDYRKPPSNSKFFNATRGKRAPSNSRP